MDYKYTAAVILTIIIYDIRGMENTQNTTFDSDVTERIIGDEFAEDMEFPFMVAIMIQIKGIYRFNCGGSLINLKFVLTAAHCVKGFRTTSFLLKLGTIKLSKKRSTIRTVEKRYYHKLFNTTAINYDVGLLRMSSEVTISNHIKPICLLTTPGFNLYGYQAEVIGWGSEKEGGTQESNLLKKASLPIIGNRKCQQSYQNHRQISDQMLCAGFKTGKSGICNGDSGGPLVKRGYQPAQIGISSWSKGCARKFKYGVFTRIEKVAYWIRKITTFDECKIPLKNQAKNSVKNPVNNSGKDSVKNSVTSPVENSIKNPVTNSKNNSVKNHLNNFVKNSEKSQVENSIKNSARNSANNLVKYPINNALHKPVTK